MTKTLKHKVYDIKTLQRQGVCRRPEKGEIDRRITALVNQLVSDPEGGFRLLVGSDGKDIITYAGASGHLRKMRERDLANFGDVALGLKNGHPAIFLHGCTVALPELKKSLGVNFVRQNLMRGLLEKLLPDGRITETQEQVIRRRFGVGGYFPGQTDEQIASAFNVSRQRVGQMVVGSLRKLGFEPRWRLV